MRIVISLLNYRPGKIGGTETYLKRLIPCLAEAAVDDEVVLVVFPGNAGQVRVGRAREYVADRSERELAWARFLEASTPYRARWAERMFREFRPDVVFFPQHAWFPTRLPCPVVVTVHDLQHLVLPRNFPWADRVFRAGIYRYSVRHAARVIAISDWTRQTVLDHYGADPARVAVVRHGLDAPDRSVLEPVADLPVRYWYYPAASLPHKNHLALFRTWARLRAAGRLDDSLLLSGQRTAYWPRLEQEIQRLGLADRVRHLGFLREGQVATVYTHAAGVLFPSLFEGLGLPVLEAVAWGKKVLVSPLDVYRELGVPVDAQLDFSDAESVWRGLQTSGPTQLTQPPIRWEDCAQATLAVLHEAAAQP